MGPLQQRILDISRSRRLSHIGSCLSVLPILQLIYINKQPTDIVILDNAHAHLAHLVVREMYEGLGNIEELLDTHGIHCDRKAGCHVSGGSLGHGLGIAVGLALADRERTIHVVVSDGSMMEGSNWEALRVISDLNLHHIKIYCNFNGYTAVSNYSTRKLTTRMKQFVRAIEVFQTDNGEGFEGVQGHYKVL